MEHLKDADLQQRAKDVFNNLIILNKKSKISFPPLSNEIKMDYLMKIYT